MSINNRLISTGGGAAAWDVRDIQSSTTTNLNSLGGGTNTTQQIQIVGNGNYLLEGNLNNNAYVYPLSTPNDTSTAQSPIYTQNLGSYLAQGRVIAMKEDGTRIYVSRGVYTYNPIVQFDLSTPYNITSYTSAGQWDSPIQYTGTNNLYFAMGGTRCYLQSGYGYTLQLNLSTAWDITTATVAYNWAGTSTAKYCTVSENGQYVIRKNVFYEMSTFGDLSTATQIGTPNPSLTGSATVAYALDGSSAYESVWNVAYGAIIQHKIT